MTGEILPAMQCTDTEKREMFALMDEHYDNTEESVFLRDLADKDYVLLLRQDGHVVGFTTQKLLTVMVDGREVHRGTRTAPMWKRVWYLPTGHAG